MTLMVSETTLKQTFSFTGLATSDQYFSLQFNEYSSEHNKSRSNYGHEQQSVVKLSHTLTDETYTFPEGVRLQSVKIFFNKHHLAHLLGDTALQEVLTQYFPFILSNKDPEPIGTDYRITLAELQVEKINVPLRLNFIQNRVLLLLEKFIVKLNSRKDATTGRLKRTDDETLRLMKVEALLVKSFSTPAPKIYDLSRISAMSPTKLKKDFKALYGLPIYEYFQKNRMLKARSLLLLGKYSIQEVGIMVGYSNFSHFASTFKKEFNILPREVSAKDGVLVYDT